MFLHFFLVSSTQDQAIDRIMSLQKPFTGQETNERRQLRLQVARVHLLLRNDKLHVTRDAMTPVKLELRTKYCLTQAKLP